MFEGELSEVVFSRQAISLLVNICYQLSLLLIIWRFSVSHLSKKS